MGTMRLEVPWPLPELISDGLEFSRSWRWYHNPWKESNRGLDQAEDRESRFANPASWEIPIFKALVCIRGLL